MTSAFPPLRQNSLRRLRDEQGRRDPSTAPLWMTACWGAAAAEAGFLICALNAALKRRSSTGLQGSVRAPAKIKIKIKIKVKGSGQECRSTRDNSTSTRRYLSSNCLLS
jgi:hypothetical protein